MLDDNEGHAALHGDTREELLEGLEPAGRRTDPDDGELVGRPVGCRPGVHLRDPAVGVVTG